ncbi:MAG: tetratricopeptide repeat protein, partial [Verrucomicrobiae bacterium]|nr:tetratricopeptide repeat protein [Verrucomicrobiae bacterium]
MRTSPTQTERNLRPSKRPVRMALRHSWIAALGLLIGISFPASGQDEDNSVEGLYRKAAELAIAGQYAESVATYEKLFDLAGEFLCEDFGPQAGGIVFDYGTALLQMQDWQKARDAFERCVKFKEDECKKAKVQNENTREVLALFQWGFCEAQLGNDSRAIELYDQYLEKAKSDQMELAKIRNAFKLRRGASLVKVGRVDEGVAEVRELFEKRAEWQVSPQFLVQGLLELGMGWVEQARKAPTPAAADQIEAQAQLFLDQNAGTIDVSPVDKYRFGFIDRLKKLGFESSEAGMQTLALRFYSMVPTLEEVEYDIQARIQILPGGAVPAAYQQILDQIAELKKKPVPADVEMQRLTARAYELLGNSIAPREIYRYLVETYPSIEKDRRAEILHEAARFSTMLGDYSSAQYFGELFMAEMPDHKLRDNVSVFMLQSLFSSQQFDQVLSICETVRGRFQLGDEQRELPDALYGLALYSLGRYQDAITAFDEYAKTYKGTPNREMVMYHRANTRMILREFRIGAELAHEFQQEFPQSEKFFDLSLADEALCRYNLEDYTAAISVAEKLETGYPESQALDRVLNIKGDSLSVRATQVEGTDDAANAEVAKLREEALQSYLKAIDVGKALEATGKNEAVHKAAAAEGIAKAIDIYVTDAETLAAEGKEENKAAIDELMKKAVALYDSFFPAYAGTFYEPQVSVYTLPALEAVGRGEDGLVQMEKMINVLGNRSGEDMDLDLLRRAIGSYAEASIRVRGEEKTLEVLGSFPGLDPNNQALLTWLKMQKVIVLQGMRGNVAKETPEYGDLTKRIDKEFQEMDQFEVKNLSEIALKMIGDYL